MTSGALRSSGSRRLVLFDIDGTIIGGGGIWGRAFLDAVHQVLPGFEIPSFSFGGRTDGWILRECLRPFAYDPDRFLEVSGKILRTYLDLARERSKEAPLLEPLPGVRALVEALHEHPEAELALLTGNVREGAYLKLDRAGLHPYFHERPGAFGDDHWDRYELPAIAVERAFESTGRRFEGKEIVIIGDTVHDVLCGRSLGVRTIAVGTGNRVCQVELQAQSPDFYFETLADTERALKAILS